MPAARAQVRNAESWREPRIFWYTPLIGLPRHDRPVEANKRSLRVQAPDPSQRDVDIAPEQDWVSITCDVQVA